MAKTRPYRSSPSPRGSLAKAPWRSGTTRGKIVLACIVLIVTGLALWRALASIDPNDETTNGNVEPIATMNTPDFHSLLVNPENPKHLLFGSHSGIQESHDEGITWENGALRDADAMQLSVSPEAPETIYATGHDVLQVSHDGGQTWQPLEHNLPGTDIHGFAQDQEDPQRLFAFVVGAGVFTSADGGIRWEPLPTQPPGGGMHLVLAASEGSLYAVTETGLLVSRDGGQSWDTLTSQPAGQIISLTIHPGDPQTLYVGTPSGLAKSTDGGASWSDLGPDGVVVLAVAVTPSNPDRVFALGDAGGIYRSNDGGNTW